MPGHAEHEQAARGAREYFFAVINAVADPIFVKDRAHRWVLLNDAMCDFIGRRRDELLGKSDHDFFSPREADVFWKKDEEVFLSGVVNINEEFLTNAKGVTLTIVTKKSLYTDQAGDKFIVGVIHDASASKKATAELKAAYEQLLSFQERMVQSEKMASLGRLVAGIAHEINNPTGYILSNLHTLRSYEQLLEDFLKTLPSTVFSGLDSFCRSLEDRPVLVKETIEGAERIKKIIQDLRIFAHPAEGDMVLGDLRVCMERAIEILTNSLKYRIKLVKEYGDIPLVCFSEQQMLQVFVNIVANAEQAIRGEGAITIRTFARGEYVYVEVKDTGAGILPEHLPKIFDPFFTTKTVGQGTGLGLSLTHSIIEKHRGMIFVESKPDEGATFTVKIPIALRGKPGEPGLPGKPGEHFGRGGYP